MKSWKHWTEMICKVVELSREASKIQVSHLYYNYELSNYQKVLEFAKLNKKSSSYRICWNLVIFYFKEHVCLGLLAVLAYYQLLRYDSSFSFFLAEGMLAVDILPLYIYEFHSNETQSLSLQRIEKEPLQCTYCNTMYISLSYSVSIILAAGVQV